MTMIGLMIDHETGDMLLDNGEAVIGDTSSQTMEAVLLSMRGEWKEFPLLGGEAPTVLGGNVDVMWRGRLKKMLESCGVKVSKIEVNTDNTITIE